MASNFPLFIPQLYLHPTLSKEKYSLSILQNLSTRQFFKRETQTAHSFYPMRFNLAVLIPSGALLYDIESKTIRNYRDKNSADPAWQNNLSSINWFAKYIWSYIPRMLVSDSRWNVKCRVNVKEEMKCEYEIKEDNGLFK